MEVATDEVREATQSHASTTRVCYARLIRRCRANTRVSRTPANASAWMHWLDRSEAGQRSVSGVNSPARRRIDMDSDTAMRLAAFAHIKKLRELRDGLTGRSLSEYSA
jgi:hypothetical protein